MKYCDHENLYVYGIVRSLCDDSTSLKAVQKPLINSVGNRDYSVQETCHLLLQLPLIHSSRDFTVLSLSGSRQVQNQVENQMHQGTQAPVFSTLDHYVQRPTTTMFQDMNFLHFAQYYYSMPKDLGSDPKHHKTKVVIIPYCFPDPSGPKYEQYWQYKLMQHKPFRHVEELKGTWQIFTEAYNMEDDIYRVEHQRQTTENNQDSDNEESLLLSPLT